VEPSQTPTSGAVNTGRSVAVEIAPDLFRTVLGHFGSGVVVLSTLAPDGPVGMSCQSFFSVSLDPPLIAVSPARTSTTWPRIAEVGHFAVSILAHDQEEVCRAFAVSGGDKFLGVEWHPAQYSGAPLLEGALAWLDCTIDAVHEAGDHYLVVARVLALEARTGEPLMFYRGGFGSFHQRVV
jgi:3-hydroxy-9,10-secoandrosta-1,3,5(10)-triene-9,17-dione monooxygenase reductase component